MSATDGVNSLPVHGRSSMSPRHNEGLRSQRRQTVPCVFPKESDRLQDTSDTVQEISRCLERLDNNYHLAKKQLADRQMAFMDALNSQYTSVSTQLDRSFEAKRVQLHSLLRHEEGRNHSDVQNSTTAGTLYTGFNGSLSDGHQRFGSGGVRGDLSQLCNFPMAVDNDQLEIPDFFRLSKRASASPRLEIDRGIDLSGKGYNRASGDFSSVWNNYSADDHRSAGLSDSFTVFDLPSKQNGSYLSNSSGYNQDVTHSSTSSAIFPHEIAPMSPFSAPNKVFSYDARSSGTRALPQDSPPSCFNGDFFSSPPRALPDVPESAEDKALELLRNPQTVDLLHTLSQLPFSQLQRSLPPGQSRVSAQNPYGGMGNGSAGFGLRRTNSNKSRSRSRRSSLPDASRFNSWTASSAGSQYPSRTGSFCVDGPSDTFSEMMNDDAFLPSEGSRNGHGSGMRELEIMCRFGEIGQQPGQMNAPHGFCLGYNQEVIVADTNNHRIQFFDSRGNFLESWGNAGKRDGQLWYPRKVAWMPETSRVVVCDRGHDRSRVQIFSRSGAYVRTIHMDYVAIVAGMTVYRNQIVIVDSVNPTCLILDDKGSVVFFFPCHKHMKEPSDVVIANNMFYICDFKGHCVCAYNGKGEFVSQIGDHPTINFPNGIDVTEQGHILVGDSHGNRFHVAAYAPDGRFLAEYECPHMKVSRCCGLVLTPQGHIVTIAKNNNFVLILERLGLGVTSEGNEALSEVNTQVTEETQF